MYSSFSDHYPFVRLTVDYIVVLNCTSNEHSLKVYSPCATPQQRSSMLHPSVCDLSATKALCGEKVLDTIQIFERHDGVDRFWHYDPVPDVIPDPKVPYKSQKRILLKMSQLTPPAKDFLHLISFHTTVEHAKSFRS